MIINKIIITKFRLKMYFFDPELEQAALKAYFEDPITDDTENEDSNEDYYDGAHQNKYLNHKVFS